MESNMHQLIILWTQKPSKFNLNTLRPEQMADILHNFIPTGVLLNL